MMRPPNEDPHVSGLNQRGVAESSIHGDKPWRRATIIDVAKAANVSKSTVSLALQGSTLILPETIDRVNEAAREVGYVRNESARKLASKAQRTLGFFVRDVYEPVYGAMHRAVQAACDARGIELLSTTIGAKTDPERELQSLQKLVGSGISALIVGSGTNNPEDLKRLGRLLPIVIAGRPQRVDGLISVGNDEETNGRTAVDILAGQGHRRILLLRVAHEGSYSIALRLSAARERMRELGLELVDLELPTGQLNEIGEALGPQFGPVERPTAILCRSDAMAMDALRWLRANSIRSPRDVSVIGFGGWTLGLDLIGLSTVELAVDLVAEEAVYWGDRLMRGTTAESTLLSLIPGKYQENGSIGPAAVHE